MNMNTILINPLPTLFSVSDRDIKRIEERLGSEVTLYEEADEELRMKPEAVVSFNTNTIYSADCPPEYQDTVKAAEKHYTYIRDRKAVIVPEESQPGSEVIVRPRKRVMLAVPCHSHIEAETIKSINDLIIGDDVECTLEIVKGYTVATARNELTSRAIEGKYDYVFWIDADMILPPMILSRLMAVDADLATGWYVKKIPGRKDGVTELLGPDKLQRLPMINILESELSEQKGIINILGCGLGCSLMKTSALEKLSEGGQQPFVYVVNYDKSICSEDLYMCINMRKLGMTLKADTTQRCGHVGQFIY